VHKRKRNVGLDKKEFTGYVRDMSSNAVPVCKRGMVLRCGAQGILPTDPDCQQTSRASEVPPGLIPFVEYLGHGDV
jgi:hypothetical protein